MALRPVPAGPHARGGLSEARLARLHDAMAAAVRGGVTPGLVSAVSRHGEASVDAIGALALDGPTPMRRDAIFRISSMTKPVTAVATLVLAEEGKLRLDEPVDRLLPELAGRVVLRSLDAALDDTVPAQRPITVRDLLTFRLGTGMIFAMPGTYAIQDALADAVGGPGMPAPAAGVAPDEYMRRLGALPLVFQPGERWMYNTGAQLLGVLAARAAGQPFETFLRERIFEPLGMVDTSFSVPPEKRARFATSYMTDAGDGSLVPYDEPHGQWARPPAFPDGAAGLVSTTDDFLAFGQMLLDGGRGSGGRVLSRLSVEAMRTDQLTPRQKGLAQFMPGFFDTHGWGFGVAIVTARDDIAAVPGRFGWDGGMGTSFWVDPHEDMVTLLMTQAAWTSPVAPPHFSDFWTMAYAAIDD